MRLARLALVVFFLVGVIRAAFAQDEVATVGLMARLYSRSARRPTGMTPQSLPAGSKRGFQSLLRSLDALAPPVARETAEGWSVMSGIPVVTVTPRDAEDNLTTPPALVRQWAMALDRSPRGARERRPGFGGRFFAETHASAEAAFGRLSEAILSIIPRALAALAVILLFWGFARAVRAVLRRLFTRTIEDVTVESLIKQLTYYAIIAMGFFVAVDALGFDPSTVAAGLSLTGIVLGFALKDILSNLVSGLLLLTLRPFEIGDQPFTHCC